MTRKTVRKFQYQIAHFQGGTCVDSPETIRALNKLGLQGWQLVERLHESNKFDPEHHVWWWSLFMREK